MRATLIRVAAGLLAVVIVNIPAMAYPQGVPAPAPVFSPEQLDQLLAPIALYPDQLLTQILTAATYPFEVVQADRWEQDPNNAGLHGDQLAAALEPQDWDPSVKSLVPFPQVLKMMDTQLDWTQKIGNAFLAQPNDVMDSVQRLRREAQSAGTLSTTPQQVVSTQGQTVTIVPASPEIVYVPCYNPGLVYGPWPYAAFPPFYYPLSGCYPGINFGLGFAIIGALWGWEWWDWDHHFVHWDHDRYNAINRYNIDHRGRQAITGDTWQHDPNHRRGVAYPTPQTRAQFQAAPVRPAAASREFRGFEQPAATQVQRGAQARGAEVSPSVAARPAAQVHGAQISPSVAARPAAPVFEGFGTPRSDVQVHEQRGQASRSSVAAPSAAPAVRAPSAPASSGRTPPTSGPSAGAASGGGRAGAGKSSGARH